MRLVTNEKEDYDGYKNCRYDNVEPRNIHKFNESLLAAFVQRDCGYLVRVWKDRALFHIARSQPGYGECIVATPCPN